MAKYNTIEELAEVASNWWYEKVKSPRFDAGADNSALSMAEGLMTIFAAKDRKKSGENSAEHFKVALKYIITRELAKGYCSLDCDYGPDKLLTEACQISGFPTSSIPWKSYMHINSKNGTVEAKCGYGDSMSFL